MVLKSKHYLLLLLQLLRFGIVGLSAATVHFTLVVLLVETGNLQPLVANIIAFGFAFQVSYWGHRSFTFHGTQQRHVIALPRLLLASILAFIANESLFFLLMKQCGLPYPLALILVLSILPLLMFIISKWWVFSYSH